MTYDGRVRLMILGLNYAPETTGIAPYTTALAEHLAAQNYDTTVISGHPHYPEWQLHAGFEKARKPMVVRGVRIVRVKHPVPRNPTGIARLWMELVFAYRCALKLVQHRPSIVIVVSPALLALAPAVLLRRVLGHRVGVVVQDLYGAALAEAGLGGAVSARVAGWLERRLLSQAQGIVVIHEVFKSRLAKSGIPAQLIEVVPNWVHVSMPPTQDRGAIRSMLGWQSDEFVAVHAGNMGAKQGLEGLVDVARLAQDRGIGVRIVLMGDGSRRQALEELGKGLANLTIMDPLPKGRFEAALGAADCLLLHERPGVVEMSVPSKLTTYFASGRPVVAATDPRSGAASLMAASGAGIAIPAGSASNILEAIRRLAKAPDQAARFGEDGRRYAAQHLSGTASLKRHTEWVRRLATP